MMRGVILTRGRYRAARAAKKTVAIFHLFKQCLLLVFVKKTIDKAPTGVLRSLAVTSPINVANHPR